MKNTIRMMYAQSIKYLFIKIYFGKYWRFRAILPFCESLNCSMLGFVANPGEKPIATFLDVL